MSKVILYCRVREERGFRIAVPVTVFYVGYLGFVEFKDLDGRKVFVNFGGRFIDAVKVIHRQNYVPVLYARYSRSCTDHILLGTFRVCTLTRDSVCDVLSDYEVKVYRLREILDVRYARESKITAREDNPLDRFEVARVVCVLDKNTPNYCFVFLPKDLSPTHFRYVAVFGHVLPETYLGVAIPPEVEDIVIAVL